MREREAKERRAEEKKRLKKGSQDDSSFSDEFLFFRERKRLMREWEVGVGERRVGGNEKEDVNVILFHHVVIKLTWIIFTHGTQRVEGVPSWTVQREY